MRKDWNTTFAQRVLSNLRADRLATLWPSHRRIVQNEVDLASGAVIHRWRDLWVEGPLELCLARTYHSAWSHRKTRIGFGWCHSWDEAMSTEPGRVVWRDGNGREIEFDSWGKELAPGTVLKALVEPTQARRVDDGWEIRCVDGTVRCFAESSEGTWRLDAIRRRGQTLSLEYGSMGHLVRARLGSVSIELDYRDDLLSAATLRCQQGIEFAKVRYEYDEESNLTVVHDSLGNQTHFAYENHILVSRKCDAASQFWGYDGDTRSARCIRTWRGDDTDDFAFRYRNGATTVVGAEGDEHTYSFDALHRPLSAPRIGTLAYHEAELGSWIDLSGREIRYHNEEDGEVVVTHLRGTERYRLDAEQRVLSKTDAMGQEIRQRYNPFGELIEVLDADERRSRVEYSSDRSAAQASGAEPHRLEFDENGWTRVVESLESRVRMERDAAGRIIGVHRDEAPPIEIERDPRGRTTRLSCAGQTTTFEFDREDRPVRVRRPAGDWRCERDARGLPRTVINSDRALQLDYDHAGRLTEVRQGSRNWRFSYDRAGRVAEEVDFDGGEYTYRYAGPSPRVIELTIPGRQRIKLRYDDRDQPEQATTSTGIAYRLAFNSGGRLISAARNDHPVDLERNRSQQVIEERSGEATIRSRYPTLARNQLVTSLGLSVTMAGTDREERRLQLVTPAGGHYETLDLENGMPLPESIVIRTDRVRDATQVGHGGYTRGFCSADGRRWACAYSVDGLLETVDSPDGIYRFEYDAFGRRVRSAGPHGEVRLVWDGPHVVHTISKQGTRSVIRRPDNGAFLGMSLAERLWGAGPESAPVVEWKTADRRSIAEGCVPLASGLFIDELGLAVAPSVAFHPVASHPLAPVSIADALTGYALTRPLAPHVQRLTGRASRHELRRFLRRLTAVPELSTLDSLDRAYPLQPLRLEPLPLQQEFETRP